MTYLLLQTFLLLLASYFLGAFVACLVKSAFFGAAVEAPAQYAGVQDVDGTMRPPIVMPPQPVRTRQAQPVTPRAIDPVQPKIEVLRRPEPRPAPAVLDPSRFERALIGPDPNEGIARRAIVEIRESILPPVTDIYVPKPPELPPPPVIEEPPPEPSIEEPVVDEEVVDAAEPEIELEKEREAEPAPEPRKGGLAARLRDATTAAAAGAVAAAKAAAAASVTMPGLGLSRRQAAEERRPAEQEEETARLVQDDEVENLDAERGAENFERPPEAPADEAVAEIEPPSANGQENRYEPAPEAIEPEPPSAPAPAPPPPTIQAPIAATPPIEGGDDFQRIRAIDLEIEKKLKARGITYFEHIAAWSASDIKRIGQELDIPGRIDREQWVEQAQILAKGGETYYSRNRKATLKATDTPSDNAGNDLPKANTSAMAGSSQAATSQALEEMGVAGASKGRSVAEMAAAAAAAIAAASASVTRGLKPIEPISPLSKVDPKLSLPARITDAIREKENATPAVAPPDDAEAKIEAGAEGPQDDLKRIRGIGVLIEKRLNGMGIRRYEQIANWTSGDIDRVSRMLEFKGRIERESWVEQARILASNGQTEFSRRVDRGEVDTSRES